MITPKQSDTEPYSARSHLCFATYTFLILTLPGWLGANPDSKRNLEDFAQLYVNEYHPPADSVKLSAVGKNRSKALAKYSIGRRLENEGKTREAIQAFREVLNLQPDASSLARKTAALMARAGQREEAQALLEKCLADNPGDSSAYISLSNYLTTYRGGGETRDRAIAVAEDALNRFPDDFSVYDHITRLYLANGKKDEARQAIKKALEQKTGDPDFWLNLGRSAIRVYPIKPDQPDTPSLLLVNEFYERALTRDRKGATAEKVADYYRATRQWEKAETIYQELIAEQTDRLDLRKNLSRVYEGLNDQDKVLETLEGIVTIDSQNGEAHQKIAQIYLKRDDRVSAVKHLRSVLRINKKGAEDYLSVAGLMVRTEPGQDLDPKVREEAIKFLNESAYLFPDNPAFPYYTARQQRALEKWGDAVKSSEKVIELAEKERPEMLDEFFYFGFAAAVERDGDIKRAEKLFRKTIELINKNQPDEDTDGQYQGFVAQTYNYLGYMWLENDMKIEQAGEMIKTAIDLDPESGAIADSMGWFHFKKGDYEAAKKDLLRAEQLIEEPDAVIFDHIGQAFFHLGDHPKAIEYLEKAVEHDPDKKEFTDRLKEYREAKPATQPADVTE